MLLPWVSFLEMEAVYAHTSGMSEHPMKEPRASGGGQEDDSAARDSGPRPTPARVVMEGASEAGGGAEPQRRTFRDPSNGREWVLSVAGRSTSGVLPLRSIRLMEVRFAPAEMPDSSARMVLCQETDLGELSDDEVLSLFRRSRVHGQPDTKARGGRSPEGRGGARRGRGG
jgi:hypothetical protein